MKKQRTRNSCNTKEFTVLGLFAVILTLSVIFDISLVTALCIGYVLFFLYALFAGMKVKEIFRKSLSGILTVKNVLITFILIGILTGLWRACGTVASIVSYSAELIKPSVMILLTFLLNCLISVLTGTAFGTAATMGTICMTMALTIDINPMYTGGAILAGAYFGDRCSPVSTSALLVSELTGTDIYENIKNMLKTVAVPFAVSAVAYWLIGKFSGNGTGVNTAVLDSFREQFNIGLIPLIPAVIILISAICRLNVKLSMSISILAAAAVAVFYQQISITDILTFAFSGYETEAAGLAPLINGGGITSMIRVFLIVCISSCYSGIFEATGLLCPIQEIIERVAQKTSAFAVMIPVSVLTGMIACNQTLTIMLTNQLCKTVEKDKKAFAVYLEDTAVVIAPLIPWSIAGAVPLSSCDAPPESRLFAFILYLIPLCDIIFLSLSRLHRKPVKQL